MFGVVVGVLVAVLVWNCSTTSSGTELQFPEENDAPAQYVFSKQPSEFNVHA